MFWFRNTCALKVVMWHISYTWTAFVKVIYANKIYSLTASISQIAFKAIQVTNNASSQRKYSRTTWHLNNVESWSSLEWFMKVRMGLPQSGKLIHYNSVPCKITRPWSYLLNSKNGVKFSNAFHNFQFWYFTKHTFYIYYTRP